MCFICSLCSGLSVITSFLNKTQKEIHHILIITCAMCCSKQPTQHRLVGSEQGKVTHLDTIERCHTHVEEHTIEHWHGNELKNTEHSKKKKDINVTRVTVT